MALWSPSEFDNWFLSRVFLAEYFGTLNTNYRVTGELGVRPISKKDIGVNLKL